MTGDKDFDLLQNEGDPLEKLICRAVEPLFPVISPYARVWARHIYPRRIFAAAGSLCAVWTPLVAAFTQWVNLFARADVSPPRCYYAVFHFFSEATRRSSDIYCDSRTPRRKRLF
jgi:hypothetical protein